MEIYTFAFGFLSGVVMIFLIARTIYLDKYRPCEYCKCTDVPRTYMGWSETWSCKDTDGCRFRQSNPLAHTSSVYDTDAKQTQVLSIIKD